MDYDYYGQFEPPVDRFLFNSFFEASPHYKNGFFIECGAFDGRTESSCLFFEETLHWKGINIEASPIIYRQLADNRPNCININAALSDTTGEMHFTQVIHPVYGELNTNSSLHHMPEHKTALDAAGCTYRDYTVPTITYPDLVEQYHLNHVNLFVLDVEGHEINVLRSMKNASVLPDVFCVEHGHLDQKLIIDTVERLGYRFVAEEKVNSYFLRLGLVSSEYLIAQEVI